MRILLFGNFLIHSGVFIVIQQNNHKLYKMSTKKSALPHCGFCQFLRDRRALGKTCFLRVRAACFFKGRGAHPWLVLYDLPPKAQMPSLHTQNWVPMHKNVDNAQNVANITLFMFHTFHILNMYKCRTSWNARQDWCELSECIVVQMHFSLGAWPSTKIDDFFVNFRKAGGGWG